MGRVTILCLSVQQLGSRLVRDVTTDYLMKTFLPTSLLFPVRIYTGWMRAVLCDVPPAAAYNQSFVWEMSRDEMRSLRWLPSTNLGSKYNTHLGEPLDDNGKGGQVKR